MLVKIKPINKEKWHGKEGNDSFTQPTSIHALYNRDTGKYNTGLSSVEKERLEKETGFDLSDTFNPNEPHPFWDSRAATLVLPNHTIILNTNIPLDFIKIHIAKSSKFIANSLSELESGNFPNASHVIFDEEEEITVKAKKVELKQKAYEIGKKLDKQSKVNLILIITGKILKNQSSDYIEVSLNDIIENNTTDFLEYAGKSKEYIKNRSLILEAISSNVLQKRPSGIFYMDELIGGSVEDAIDYLNDVKNQNLKVVILDKLM